MVGALRLSPRMFGRSFSEYHNPSDGTMICEVGMRVLCCATTRPARASGTWLRFISSVVCHERFVTDTFAADLLQEYAKGLAAYRERDWDAADRHSRRCREINAKDAPSAIFLERITMLRAEPPPGDWDGVWRFTHK
jgi:hypothetical protein